MLKSLAAEAAAIALKDYRAEQKRGRQDRGSGDERMGVMLREAREAMGWSQEELAEKSRLHPTTIGKIESAHRGMSLATFCRLSQAFFDADEVDWSWETIEYVSNR